MCVYTFRPENNDLTLAHTGHSAKRRTFPDGSDDKTRIFNRNHYSE